jgi:hypothetical protein
MRKVDFSYDNIKSLKQTYLDLSGHIFDQNCFFMLDGYGLWGCLWEKGLAEVSAGRIHQFLKRPREVVLVATHGVEGNFTHGLLVILQELPGRLICTGEIHICGSQAVTECR